MRISLGLTLLILGNAFDLPAQGTGCTEPMRTSYSLPHMLNRELGFAVSSSGGGESTVLKTWDGGATWYPQGKVRGGTLHSIHFPVPDTGYIAGGYQFWKSTDGGGAWTEVPDTRIGVGYSLHFQDSRTGYLAGYVSGMPAPGLIQKSNDGGATWVTQLEAPSILYGMDHPARDTAFVVGTGGHVFKTVDGGAHWASIRTGTADLHAVEFLDTRRGFAAGVGGTLLRTENGGTDWTRIDLGATVQYSVLEFTDTLTGYLLNGGQHFASLEDARLMKTQDGGMTWKPLPLPEGTRLSSLDFSDSLHGIATQLFPTDGGNFSRGRILWTSDGGLSWKPGCVVGTLASLPPPEAGDVNSTGFFARAEPGRIAYGLGRSSWVQAHLLDSKGRRSAVLFSGHRERGQHTFPWPPGPGRGVFLLELRAGTDRALLKLR